MTEGLAHGEAFRFSALVLTQIRHQRVDLGEELLKCAVILQSIVESQALELDLGLVMLPSQLRWKSGDQLRRADDLDTGKREPLQVLDFERESQIVDDEWIAIVGRDPLGEPVEPQPWAPAQPNERVAICLIGSASAYFRKP